MSKQQLGVLECSDVECEIRVGGQRGVAHESEQLNVFCLYLEID